MWNTNNGPYSGNYVLGVFNLTLPNFLVHTMHAPPSTNWEFDVALKKMSPFRLFSTLYVSHTARMNISLCHIDDTLAFASSLSPFVCQSFKVFMESCVVEWTLDWKKNYLNWGCTHIFCWLSRVPVLATHFLNVLCRKTASVPLKWRPSMICCNSHLPRHLWAVWYSGLCTGRGVPLTWMYQIAAASSIEVVLYFKKSTFILSHKNLTALLNFYKLTLFSWFMIPLLSWDNSFGHFSVLKRYPKDNSTPAQFMFCIKWGMFLFC